jgi:1,4-alpha-glucan branching enzyme
MPVKTAKHKKPEQPQRASARTAGKASAQSGTLFVCDVDPDAKEVFVVGEFNNWDTQSDRLTKRKGAFQKMMRLAPGEYQYKFLVDGEWHCDPSAPRQVPNEYGTLNSVIRVDEMSRK